MIVFIVTILLVTTVTFTVGKFIFQYDHPLKKILDQGQDFT